MRIVELGVLRYGDAWSLQEQIHTEVLAGSEERILFVEHPPVITFGRRAELTGPKNLLSSVDAIQKLGVEVVQSDRGGDVTFHGPGQLVIYPIIRLAEHKLSVGSYVRRLQEIIIAALADLGVEAHRDESAIGVWAESPDRPEKICSLGVRIRRGVSMHGLALNVTTDLSYFNLIVPCGICDRGVTSIQKILGDQTPSMDRVKQAVANAFASML
jgi:lipoyl(octanoyl) transferase